MQWRPRRENRRPFFQLFRIVAIGRSWNRGRTVTHEGTWKFTLSASISSIVDFPSVQCLFLSFQMFRMVTRNETFHVFLPLWQPTPIFQASYSCTKVFGSSPLHSNSFQIDLHSNWVHLQLRSKGSIDSAVGTHIGQALTIIFFLCCKLFIVIILIPPCSTNHPKATTLE